MGRVVQCASDSRFDAWIPYQQCAVVAPESNRGSLPEDNSLEKFLKICELHGSLNQAQELTVRPGELAGKCYGPFAGGAIAHRLPNRPRQFWVRFERNEPITVRDVDIWTWPNSRADDEIPIGVDNCNSIDMWQAADLFP